MTWFGCSPRHEAINPRNNDADIAGDLAVSNDDATCASSSSFQ
jgi:hypothetical protein